MYKVYKSHICLFLLLSVSLRNTQLASYYITPLYIVKVPCLYAQLQTVITFHYWRVDPTKSYRRGGSSVTQSLTEINILLSTTASFSWIGHKH